MKDLSAQSSIEVLHAFAMDKWGTTNPILVADDERELRDAYMRATSGSIGPSDLDSAALEAAIVAEYRNRTSVSPDPNGTIAVAIATYLNYVAQEAKE